ncbi:carboxypeptidase B-like [Clavelina lepadiformis]|uniref:carboxypeptidase B-like n=1 Tax=Clavelina lepadiformis TaxID=159417 RepID=UPI004043832C
MKLFVVLLALCALSAAKRFFHGDQVLRLHPTEDHHFQAIATLEESFPIDYWTDLYGNKPVDIHVPKKYLPRVKVFLRRNRVNFEIFIEDLQKSIDEQVTDRALQLNLATFDYNVYHTMDEINGWIDDMASTYSTATKVDIGSTYEGKTIHGLKISTGGFNRPAFFIDCGIHAREWVAPASCMYAVKYLVEATSGSDEYNLLQNIDFYVVPVANPDGYLYTWSGDRMWRKTRSNNNKVCVGVDPNRNWDINWSGPGASSSSCNDAYYGPSAMSEVEVQGQANYLRSIPNLKGYIDVHAYSQYWMYPYAYSYSTCPDDTFLRSVATESASAIQAVHGMTYQSGPISEVIYQASGSTTDYVYQEIGVKCAFAAELRDTGRYGFTLPERFIQPTAEESFAGLKVIASYVANGQC